MILVVHRAPGGDVVARELPITEAQCRAYADGAYLQDAFPDLRPQDREFIKSGFSLEDDPDVLADVVDAVTMAIDEWIPDPAMEPNPNGHPYGCGCDECMEFYRSLK